VVKKNVNHFFAGLSFTADLSFFSTTADLRATGLHCARDPSRGLNPSMGLDLSRGLDPSRGHDFSRGRDTSRGLDLSRASNANASNKQTAFSPKYNGDIFLLIDEK
jgi:hypothetical protein